MKSRMCGPLVRFRGSWGRATSPGYPTTVSARPTAYALTRSGGVRFRWSLLTRRAAAANAVSPLSFPPLETPFPDPPFQKESTKGGKPRGAPARRPLWRGRRHGASLSPCLSRPKTGLPSARRRPTGCRRHSAAQPPLRLPPPGAGRVGRAATGSARSGLRHGVGLPWNGGGQAVLPAPGIRRNPGFTARRTRLRPRVAGKHRHAAAQPGSAPASTAPAKPSRCLLVAPPGRPEAVTFSLQPPEMVGRLKKKRVEVHRLDTGGSFASKGWMQSACVHGLADVFFHEWLKDVENLFLLAARQP